MKNELIDYYSLMPHPEGGWYKETYKSNESIKKADYLKDLRESDFCQPRFIFY